MSQIKSLLVVGDIVDKICSSLCFNFLDIVLFWDILFHIELKTLLVKQNSVKSQVF